MAKPVKIRTTVLPGHRIEVVDLELAEGETVDLTIEPAIGPEDQRPSVWEVLQSLPDPHHTPEEWEEIERQFQEERNSWDR